MSETRARENHPTREKATCGVSPFLAWGDFHARSRFARSTIPEEKWGTTRSLPFSSYIFNILSCYFIYTHMTKYPVVQLRWVSTIARKR